MTPANEDDLTTGSPPARSDTAEDVDGDDPTNPDVPDVPGVLDWILGGLIVLGGLLFALAGAVAFTVIDRERLETAVTAEDVDIEGMTEPEFVELVMSLVTWIGAGLVVTGLAMVVLGAAYVVHRRRVRERAAAGEPTSDFIAHALVGAMVSGVTSFVPFSPVIGGGLAGYLERGDSERTISVGTASAVLMSAPFLVLGLFGAAGLTSGFAAIDDGGPGAVMAVVVVVAGAFSLGFAAVLGAVGGWIGGKLAE